MSTVITDNLTGKTSAGDVTITSEGGSATMQLQQGVAKAWGGEITDSAVATDSFNIASITDLGTGSNQTNWTSVFNNAGYSNPANTVWSAGGGRNVATFAVTTAKLAMTSYVYTGSVSSTSQQFSSHGDLA